MVALQSWCCSNKNCSWSETPSIKGRLSGKVHTDLLKLQAEFGANHSYRKASKALRALTGNTRKINNRSRLHKVTNDVGKLLGDSLEEGRPTCAENPTERQEAATHLCSAVDGGYVHDANNKGHNFEVMMGKAWRPENVKRIDKHHTKILEKHGAASAKADKQATMKEHLIEAAKREGIDKETTMVTALADGASNCWNVLEALIPYCLAIVFILDWFHIGKYIQGIKKTIPQFENQFHNVREALWYGTVDVALYTLSDLLTSTTDTEHIRLITNFYNYINDNRTRIVNYDARKKASLPYTSHVAESTVEHMLNERGRKKQKMQWSRDGIHAVMQIRVSQCSNDWEDDWNNVIKPQFKLAA